MLLDEVSRALAVFAHPDDAEFMFGGTIARLTGQGAEVNYVVCTDGANGGVDLATTGAELVRIRAAELRAAADVLGVGRISSLGYPNDELQVDDDLKRDIIREIRRFRPEVLLTMAPQRLPGAPLDFQHGDHLAASEATFVAAYPQSYKARIYPELLDEGLEPFRVTEIWMSAFEDANLYVDVTDQIDVKMAAIWCHASQHREAAGNVDWLLEHRVGPPMQEAGRRIGCRYAERYLRVPTKRD
jgi:LmbE family N-acetylglucosaminyl deacetylase